MTNADHNRARAADLLARAKAETDPMMRAEWQHLAKSYLHLAEQAERKSRSEVPHSEVPYEVSQQRPNVGLPQQHQQQQHQQQQQQQPQPPEPHKK